jgi:Ca2+/H+ antiporter
LHFWVAIATLAGSTVIIALCAEFMVGSIDAITQNGALSDEFVGLILLPIVGNAAEHATAVTVAVKDKMDLAIGVAVGSSMQVALFLIPMLVVIGWGMGNDEMNLSFDTFQVAVMFVAVLLVNYLIGDGKSHWLEGWLLMCLYAIIAVCAFCKSRTVKQNNLNKITNASILRVSQLRHHDYIVIKRRKLPSSCFLAFSVSPILSLIPLASLFEFLFRQ